MIESPLINKIRPDMEELINKQAKVSDFINTVKKWNLQKSSKKYYQTSLHKISIICTPINNFEDKIAWIFTSNGDFTVKQ